MIEEQLHVNMILRMALDQDRLIRLLWFEPAGLTSSRIAAYSFDDQEVEWLLPEELQIGLQEGHLAHLTDDPFSPPPVLETDLTEGQRHHRDERLECIRSLVEDPEHSVLYQEYRSAPIAAAAEQHGTTYRRVLRLLRLYWAGGQVPNALLPRYDMSGGRGKRRTSTARPDGPKRGRPPLNPSQPQTSNVDERTARLLALGGKRFVLEQGMTLDDAYTRTLTTFFGVPGPLDAQGKPTKVPQPEGSRPTFGEFRYHFEQSLRPAEEMTARAGLRRYALLHRPLLGNTRKLALGPGVLSQVDSTIGDLHLVSAFRRQEPIGRPVIFVIRDVFSRMVTGFHISLEGPNWPGLALALEHSFLEKAGWCQRIGRPLGPGEWPCHGKPETLCGDRGPAELLHRSADFLASHLGIRIDNAAPYRADWKPFIERYFRTINDEGIGWQPGAVHGPRERGERDPRLDAVHTLASFTKLFLEIVLWYNNNHWIQDFEPDAEMAAAGVAPVPIELWKWGIENRSGRLRAADPAKVRFSLLRAEEATATRRGLYLPKLGLHYTCERAIKEGWFVGRPGRERMRVPVGVYDSDISEIYLRLGASHDPEPCRLLDRHTRFQGFSRAEVLEERAAERAARRAHQEDTRVSRAEHLARIDAITDDARAAKDTALRGHGSSKTPSMGVRAARAEEARAQRARRPDGSGTPVIPLHPAPAAETAPVPARSELDEILRVEEQLDE